MPRVGLIDHIGTHVEREKFADLLRVPQLYQGVLSGVHDLEDIHFGFDCASLWDQQPALLIDAALAIAHDAPLIGEGEGAASSERPGPFCVEREGEWRVEDGRDGDAFHPSIASAISDDEGIGVGRGSLSEKGRG